MVSNQNLSTFDGTPSEPPASTRGRRFVDARRATRHSLPAGRQVSTEL